MLYTLNLDKDNFIISIAHTKNDDIELDLSEVDMKYLSAYKLTDTGLVLDEERLALIISEEEQTAKEEEIVDLKTKLNNTDYIMAETFESVMSLTNPVTFIADFIKILSDFKNEYAQVIVDRKAWRQRIKELSK